MVYLLMHSLVGEADLNEIGRFRFGPIIVALSTGDVGICNILQTAISLYESVSEDEPVDLDIRIDRADIGMRFPFLGKHWDFSDGFAARFGHFYVQRWRLQMDTATIVCGIVSSPLHHVRPLVDYECHTAVQDIGKMLHEQVLVPATLMLFGDRVSVFHAATLADSNGAALMVTGQGGVGKTSFALEVGRKRHWGFVSDDMVLADRSGIVYLNAAWPKIYAYNVEGDPSLETQIIQQCSTLERIHWGVLRRWPWRVRRSIAPNDLYGHVTRAAKLSTIIEVVRGEGSDLSIVRERNYNDFVERSIAVMQKEMRRLSGHIDAHTIYRERNKMPPLETTWSDSVWRRTATEAIKNAALYRVVVPEWMGVSEYRRKLSIIVENFFNQSRISCGE